MSRCHGGQVGSGEREAHHCHCSGLGAESRLAARVEGAASRQRARTECSLLTLGRGQHNWLAGGSAERGAGPGLARSPSRRSAADRCAGALSIRAVVAR